VELWPQLMGGMLLKQMNNNAYGCEVYHSYASNWLLCIHISSMFCYYVYFIVQIIYINVVCLLFG
jgi:hypothetical protein